METEFNESDFKDVETHIEHLYSETFEEIIAMGYDPNAQKMRLDIYTQPIIFNRLILGIPRFYKLSNTENMVYGSKLGISILQHDDRIKALLDTVECDAFKDNGEFEYITNQNMINFCYATATITKRMTACSIEWVIEAIKETSNKLCMDNNQLYVICYLLGLEQATKLPKNIKSSITTETNKFWTFIEYKTNKL